MKVNDVDDVGGQPMRLSAYLVVKYSMKYEYIPIASTKLWPSSFNPMFTPTSDTWSYTSQNLRLQAPVCTDRMYRFNIREPVRARNTEELEDYHRQDKTKDMKRYFKDKKEERTTKRPYTRSQARGRGISRP